MKISEAQKILGLGVGSTREQILRAFRDQAKREHPDAGGSGEKLSALIEAKDKLLEFAERPPSGTSWNVTGHLDEELLDRIFQAFDETLTNAVDEAEGAFDGFSLTLVGGSLQVRDEISGARALIQLTQGQKQQIRNLRKGPNT